jgi:hypothetical protein
MATSINKIMILILIQNDRKQGEIEHIERITIKGRYKTVGTGQLYDGFPDCEWKMNTP